MQVRDRNLLVDAVCVRRRAWPVVDGVDPLLGELRDRSPGLLRGKLGDELAQPFHERIPQRGSCGRGVVEDVKLAGRNELAEPRLGLVARTPGRVAKVQLRGCERRDDIRGDPAFNTDDADDLPVDEPVELDVEWREGSKRRKSLDERVNRVSSRPRPCRVGALAVEVDARLDVAEATGVESAVGRLEHDGEFRTVEDAALEHRRQRALLERDLFPGKEEKPRLSARPGELEHHRNAALHVARPKPVHGVVGDPPRQVALLRHGVEMPCEDDRRRRQAPDDRLAVVVERLAGEKSPHERHRLGFDAALRADVDELERAGGEVGSRHSSGHNDARMTARQPDRSSAAEPERGLVLAVLAPGVDAADELAELEELARTAGVEPVGQVVQHRAHPDPRTFVGKGKLEELKQVWGDAAAEVLVVDEELSPSQQRMLENSLQARVVDRTQLILDIFAQHAVSAEGKLQVELAQLEYNLPRMRGMWQHLERLGGGVGTRGPGESQLETDRRLARRRVTLLRDRLKGLSRQRDVRRKERRRSETPTVALAGYTNSGKSTLLNALTDAGVSVRDRLFETLAPTTRGFEHDGRRYLVTDTVGFVRRLPHQLVEGFAATLEETLVADLVLHVVDASTSEERLVEQIAAVESVLLEIGAEELPLELVLNKIDSLDALGRRRLANRYPEALQISAATGEGLGELRARVAERFAKRFELVRLLIPFDEGARLNELYALGAPIEQREDTPEGVLVLARLPRRELPRYTQFLVAETKPAKKRKSV